MQRWGEAVALDALPSIDLVVTGCAAVTRAGKRCGKGEGYSDLEFAILRELGHPEVPVVTTVHPLQIVADLPRDEHDLALTLIVTPEEAIEVPDPLPSPTGIDWTRLTETDLEAMPILSELRMRSRNDAP
jgi:5-formyltetrahydrofolate cyclo-ligase